jgi:5-methylcytosine-specific restriction endonuclease McrA
MIQYQRPRAPAGFAKHARPHRAKASAGASRGRKPKVEAAHIWAAHKDVLADAQHGKCAYCERKLSTHYPPVEHLAPRNEVHALPADEADWGTESHPYLANVAAGSKRKATKVSDWGYWSRAYVWSNYVVACQSCNAWKSTIYPLAKQPKTGWRPGKTTKRLADELLLDCFDEPVPWRTHFRFDAATGAVAWKTARGRATVGTCGLHRPSLQQERALVLVEVAKLCDRADGPRGLVREHAYRDLVSLGRDGMPFAGAVRGVAEDRLGMTWDEIVAYVAALP